MRFSKTPAEAAASAPVRSKPKNRLQMTSGWGALALILGSLTFPLDFVTEEPGPTFNTIGAYEGEQLISIEGAKSYPAGGALDLTTVSVAGGPNTDVFGLQVLGSWMSSHHVVYPSDLVYSPQVTKEEVTSRNTADMVSSQELAQAAALNYLGKEYSLVYKIAGDVEGGAAEGFFEEGDILDSLGGQKITRYGQIREILNENKDKPLEVRVLRGHQYLTKEVTPTFYEEENRYVLGLYLVPDFTFPMTVEYGLSNVGGPSAGMMFALGIIEELTEGEMTGGVHFAGTGTIDADGVVGPIGGIAQKMQGAVDAGAAVFLAPAENCNEVVGRVPKGLAVVKVSTLNEAAEAVKAIGAGEDPASFPTCTAEDLSVQGG